MVNFPKWIVRAKSLVRTRALSQTCKRRSNEQRDNDGINRISQRITQDKAHGAAQAMLYATGFTEGDMKRGQVGIASSWFTGNPCNMHLLDLSRQICQSVENFTLKGHNEMVGLQFNTIGVSDGISMGTDGMRYSLPSREIIADSVETVMNAQWYDGLITVPGCDKNMPGMAMAMGRINRPALMVYGGTIAPGRMPDIEGKSNSGQGEDLDIVSAFQAYGEYISGKISDDVRRKIIRHACPGQGACGGMYTANSMATALETMGLTLPGSSSNPAASGAKKAECEVVGATIYGLLREQILPRDIVTRTALENAIVITMVLGGSTNVVLHLLAIAHAFNVKLDLDDFQRISDQTPLLADLKPSGRYVMQDIHEIGGTPALLKYLIGEGLVKGDGMTVTGKTLRENTLTARDIFERSIVKTTVGSQVKASDKVEVKGIIKRINEPIKATGHITVLRGSLAPGGSVGKITGKEGEVFEGIARVFNHEDELIQALEAQTLIPQDARTQQPVENIVAIIRYAGPKGGPGMPEMLKPTSAIMGAGLGHRVALLTDGRFSGGSHGFIIGHIVPEAACNGPIAHVKDGDKIRIDARPQVRRIDWIPVTSEDFATAPLSRSYESSVVLQKFARTVSDASHGCVTTTTPPTNTLNSS